VQPDVAKATATQAQTQTQTQGDAKAQAQSAQVATPAAPAGSTASAAAAAAAKGQPVVQAPADTPKAQPTDGDPKATATVAQQAATTADAQASAVQQQPAGDAKPGADKPVPAVPVAASKPKQGQPDTAGQGQQNQQQQGTLPQPAADQARTVAQAYGRTTQHTPEVPTTAQSGTPAAAPATPVAASQPAAARAEIAAPTPVPLARAAETVEQVVRLASSRGVTHARIALTPDSLGSIDVHLRHTSDGVVARVVAHSHDAVQQLQQAAADLRQQLEGQGVNLLSLDIGHSSPDQGSAAQAQADLGDGNRGEGRGLANGGDAAGDDADAIVNSTLQLPDGVLVDVLA
jgi:flagellar hook-length control protein FliK